MTQREGEPQPARYDERYEEEQDWKRANKSELARLLDKPVGTTSEDFQKLVAQPAQPQPQPVAPPELRWVPKYTLLPYVYPDYYAGRSRKRTIRRCPLCGEIGDPPACGGASGNGPYDIVEVDE